MKTKIAPTLSSPAARTATHLGKLVRRARLARGMAQSDLAARARISAQTVMRIEAGGAAASLGAWLSVLEQLGLLKLLSQLRDSATEELMAQQARQRARTPTLRDDMDF